MVCSWFSLILRNFWLGRGSFDAVYISKVLMKVCFFTWLATRGVILAMENHRRQKVVCMSWCYLCMEAGEDVVA